MQRFAKMIRVRPDKLDEYKRLHAECWPEILDRMHRANLHNVGIFHRDGLLVMYSEYVGDDFAADQARFRDDPIMRKWQEVTAACQEPLPTAAPGEKWSPMEEVFHMD